MGQMVVVMPKAHPGAGVALSQRASEMDAGPAQRMMLAGLHVVQFPGFQKARELPAPVVHNAARRQPGQGLGEAFVKGPPG